MPRRMLFIVLTSLALGALPLLLHPTAPLSAPAPWYRSPTGWIGLIGLFWTAIAGFGGAVIGMAIAARMRSMSTLLVSLAIAAATVFIIRLYFRALF